MTGELEPGYRIDRILDTSGEGPMLALVRAFAKYRKPENFEAVNEYICAKLAHSIGVPCPPGDFALDSKNNPTAWISPLAFSESPPPVDPDEIKSSDSQLCAGILAFDSWILNLDRHDFNIIHGSMSGTWIIDHGQALFYSGDDPTGALHSVRDTVMSGSHLFASRADQDDLVEWCGRISSIDDFIIRAAVEPVRKMKLVDERHANALEEFLLYRARNIHRLVPTGLLPAESETGAVQ